MNIYVGNLSYDVTDEELGEAFSAFGTVTSARVIRDRYTDRSRGFGFVEMSDDNEAETAIAELNGKPIKGRPINANQARPREERRRPSY